jgi:hypothetical protein
LEKKISAQISGVSTMRDPGKDPGGSGFSWKITSTSSLSLFKMMLGALFCIAMLGGAGVNGERILKVNSCHSNTMIHKG